MFKTLIVNRYSADAILRLQNAKLTEVIASSSIGDLKNHYATTNAILLRSGTRVDASTLTQFPELKVVISATSGFDHIDFRLCQTKNITVMHTPSANAISAAEHTLGLIIASARRYGIARDNIKMGNWDREPLMGFELYGKTLGIIGYGRIGQRVATLARAFGMKILVHDPYLEQEHFPGIDFMGLEETFRNSDIISFHVPLTKETYHMIKESTLEWLAPNALVINASRGAVVCTHSLQNHLIQFRSFLSGLDVFESEPLASDSSLIRNANMFSTPHVGATTLESIARASDEAVDKLIEYLKTGNSSDTLPPKTLWADKLY